MQEHRAPRDGVIAASRDNAFRRDKKLRCAKTPTGIDVFLSLLVPCHRSPPTRWHICCWADRPAQASSNRKAGGGNCMKLEFTSSSSYSYFFCRAFTQLTEKYTLQKCRRVSRKHKCRPVIAADRSWGHAPQMAVGGTGAD